ncbi:hypothetical protein ACN469_06010 [Corallococcus terminator]
MQISHAIVECPLGKLLVAMTGKGICMLELGRTSSELLDKLMTRFPGATLVAPPPELTTALLAVINLLDGLQGNTDLPLSLRGTALQQKIRKALKQIRRPPNAPLKPRVRPRVPAAVPGRASSTGRSRFRATPAPG